MATLAILQRELHEVEKELHAWKTTEKPSDIRLKRHWFINQNHDTHTAHAPIEAFEKFRGECIAALSIRRMELSEVIAEKEKEHDTE